MNNCFYAFPVASKAIAEAAAAVADAFDDDDDDDDDDNFFPSLLVSKIPTATQIQ